MMWYNNPHNVLARTLLRRSTPAERERQLVRLADAPMHQVGTDRWTSIAS